MCVQSKLVKMAADAGLTLAYSSESSIEAELTRESTADILTVVVRAESSRFPRFF